MEFSVKPSIYIGIIHILQGKRDQSTIQLVLFHETCYGYETNSVIALDLQLTKVLHCCCLFCCSLIFLSTFLCSSSLTFSRRRRAEPNWTLGEISADPR